MPLKIAYDNNLRLLRIASEGTVSMQQGVDCVREMLGDSKLPNDSNILVDLDRITNGLEGCEWEELVSLVQLLRARFTGRIGIVNSHVGFMTICNMIALSADATTKSVRVFESENAAISWFKTSNDISSGSF